MPHGKVVNGGRHNKSYGDDNDVIYSNYHRNKPSSAISAFKHFSLSRFFGRGRLSVSLPFAVSEKLFLAVVDTFFDRTGEETKKGFRYL